MSNPDLKVTLRAIDQIKPDPENTRLHSEKQIGMIAESIQRFGFNDPVAVDEAGVIVEGHGRLEAAKLLKLKQLPVIELGHLTDVERRAYMIAHNRIAQLSTWDYDNLLEQVGSIMDDISLEPTMLGFSQDEYDAMLGPPPSIDDVIAEVGELMGDETWPILRFRVPPDIKAKWDEGVDGREPWEALKSLLS